MSYVERRSHVEAIIVHLVLIISLSLFIHLDAQIYLVPQCEQILPTYCWRHRTIGTMSDSSPSESPKYS